jgi:hypothetical protein
MYTLLLEPPSAVPASPMMPRNVLEGWREDLGLSCGGGEEMGGRGVATVFGASARLRIEICCYSLDRRSIGNERPCSP